VLKLAETAFGAVIDTVHVRAVPRQVPRQPRKTAPAEGVAVSRITAPLLKACEQSRAPAPHETPRPVTRPAPPTLTVRIRCDEPGPNVAVRDVEADVTTVHTVAEPLQLPPQPVKVATVLGDSVSVTDVPVAWGSVQSVAPLPQSIPLPVIFPLPDTLTVSVGPLAEVKVAVTAFAELVVRVQVLPVAAAQSPPQPVKVAPESAVAVSVAEVPSGKSSTQSPVPSRHEMPLPVIVPGPSTLTASAWSVVLCANAPSVEQSSAAAVTATGSANRTRRFAPFI
jgi:hypothetical protein